VASVSVVSGPVDADDSPVDVPEKDWGKLTTTRSIFVGVRIPYDCRSLLKFVDQAERFEMWKHTGHDSLEHYIREGLGVDPEILEWARTGLDLLGRNTC
jgi:hypothetical protein